MNRKIRGIRDDIIKRKSKWLPVIAGGAVVYLLLLLWPTFGAGIGIGIAATWIYRVHFHPGTELRSVPNREARLSEERCSKQ